MKSVLILLLGMALAPLHAAPFEKGDPAAGKSLHDKSCMTCHDNGMYTRANRIMKTPAQLAARVAACNANTGAGWFPEEERHVGAYLNQTFYHFK
ncbi:MAG: cytochrome c [Pseudomonadota bacterium]